MEQWITSIGLDIGTSTTKFIVSRLLIKQTNDRFNLPGCRIADRKVVYSSPIYTTPLKNDYEIDMESLTDLLVHEYEQSAIGLQDVNAGAVIITGETARKINAEKIIHYLAERAGDFVVATAGADLEGILAGKGSGAMERSQQIEGIVANVDIGGGTANIALFQNGKAIQTFTFHIGGRLIRLNESGEIEYVSEQIQPWLQSIGCQLTADVKAGYNQLLEICSTMSHCLLAYISGNPVFQSHLLLMEGAPEQIPAIEEIIFSGGVGRMMQHESPRTLPEVAKHSDIGPLLAYTLTLATRYYPIRVRPAIETTRATVIGAGMQNIEVSGATIYANPDHLPIKNIPLLTIPATEKGEWAAEAFEHRLFEALYHAAQLYDMKNGSPLALALSEVPYCTYELLQSLADSICRAYSICIPESSHIIFICENDMAKALGQALAKRCGRGKIVICLDQIDFTHGDYIDIGMPVSGEAVSISIKTLAFA
ncbi:ethanolamine ammonia-lyase reactivating factor EutA [Paenibacillus sediminis]|uniref:Ethanolamine utilization protein EutA n=1 Tax=Paenibacillus sediminis TaxID=664909 RepID=A0ABS4H502_9BACL|nr:ethanolamine ammonia-lyase reactivating factor EutA [Paenibacillus sediminis]MBP1937613.1 ethanolamine utilization protein EutA [Paenibacillus sediminis]